MSCHCNEREHFNICLEGSQKWTMPRTTEKGTLLSWLLPPQVLTSQTEEKNSFLTCNSLGMI